MVWSLGDAKVTRDPTASQGNAFQLYSVPLWIHVTLFGSEDSVVITFDPFIQRMVISVLKRNSGSARLTVKT
jgi:hypothetical protein